MSAVSETRIEASCSCGKRYLLRSSLAGKMGSCKCGSTFVVPSQSPPTLCPTCNSAIPLGHFFCPFCNESIAEENSRMAATSSNSFKSKDHSTKLTATAASSLAFANTSDSPAPLDHSNVNITDMSPPDPPWWKNPIFVALTILMVLATLSAAVYQCTLRGHEFTDFYLLFGVFCVIAIFIARNTSCSTLGALVVAVLAYELLGVVRYLYGITHGMHRFDTMSDLMWIGPFAGAMIAFMKGDGSGSSSFSSGCGGSCGGGCGGGGCGGCGG